jgi:hypothetical protein
MKVVFLLDNKEYVEVTPDKLQIRQLQPGNAALGIEVTVPVNGADGKPELNEDGTEKTQLGFRPFVNYAVDLQVPKPAEATPATAPAAVVAEPAKKGNGKAVATAPKSKRKAN